MKMSDINKCFAVLLMGCALFAVSCEPTENGNDVEPDFPELVTKTVQAGESVALTFDANLDWEVSVPADGIQWFWIQDGSFKTDKCSGKAGEEVVVKIGVSETEEFAQSRKTQVTLKMDGISKVIAELERPAKQRTITVYAANVVDGEIQFVEDGSAYEYNASEAENIDMIWTGSDFRLPIRVDANYSWTVKTPGWAVVDVPEDAVGTTYVNVCGVSSEYPEEAASGKIQFMAGETLVKEYVVTIPGCKDKFSYSIAMGLSELDFNFKGQVKSVMGYNDGPASAEIFGTSGVKVFAVELIDGVYDLASPDDPSWLIIEEAAYDESDGADVLQSRDVTISVSVNEGEDREAVIFFLPPTGWHRGKELFNESMDAIKEEFQQYAVRVVQHSSDQEFIEMVSDASVMSAEGVSFGSSEDENLFSMFGQTRYAYDLIYTDQYGRDYARMIFASAVTSVKVFDKDGVEDDGSKGFLSITMDEDMMGGVIDMIAEVQSVGYVVLYGSAGNTLAVVKCMFDPEGSIEEVDDVAFIGESITMARQVGATLRLCPDGKVDGEYHRQAEEDVYHLRYTMEGQPLKISIPNSAVMHTVNGWSIREYIRVNDIVYTTPVNGRVGGFKRVDGGVDIYMYMPGGRNFLRGKIIFSNASNEFILTIVCTLDLTADTE